MAFFKRSTEPITASAARIEGDNAVRRIAQAHRQWQVDGWGFYTSLPEIHYPANYIGTILSQFDLKIGLLPASNPNAEPELDPRNTEPVRIGNDVLAQLEGPTGGHPEILRRFGVNWTVAADGWLFGEDASDTTSWEFLSVVELRADQDGNMRRYPAGGSISGTGEVLDPARTTWLRFWRSSPEFSSVADGPLSALTADCQQLLALKESITSRLLSRLSQAGILYIPNTLSIPGDNNAPDGTGNGPQDRFMEKLITQMERALRERGTAAGSIPIVVRGPSGEGEHIHHITFDREIERVEMELRSELRQNIAVGLDLPIGESTGANDGSHWNAWTDKDASWKLGEHLAGTFCEGLTRTYLWPAMRKLLPDLGLSELRRVVVVADGSEAKSKVNEVEDARQLHDRLVISDKSLREASGVEEVEAPDESEYVRQLGRQLNDPYLATFELPVAGSIDWEKVSSRREGSPGVGSIVENRRPADPGDPPGKRDAKTPMAASAAEFALRHADGVVGAKIRAHLSAPAHRDLHASLKQTANDQMLAHVDLEAVGLSESKITEWYESALTAFHAAMVERFGAHTASTINDRLISARLRTPLPLSYADCVTALGVTFNSPPERITT